MTDTDPLVALVASNPKQQALLDRLIAEGRKPKCACGAPVFWTDECAECYGDDLYGHDFCPVEEFCCGC